MSKYILLLPLLAALLGCASRDDESPPRTRGKKKEWQPSYTLGLNALKNRQFLEAIRRFDEVVRIQKDSADAHYYLGVSYLGRAAELSSSFGLMGIGGNQTQYLQGGFLRAGEELKTAADLDSNHHDAHLQLGILRVAQGKYGAALKLLKRAEALNPQKSLTHLYLGIAYSQIPQNDNAEKHFKKSLDLSPNIYAHKNLGKIYLAQKRYDEAIVQLRLALKLDEDAETHCELAKALLKLEDPDQALNQLARAIQLSQDYADAHYLLGKIYLEQGREHKALEEFQAYRALASKQVKETY